MTIREKLLYLIIILLFSLVFIPSKVFAISGSVNMNCTPANAPVGDAITCTIALFISSNSGTGASVYIAFQIGRRIDH